ncbi:class I glutamine amidotransferase-like protein [Cubamyces lactineus]|nr:class I glutamine amidotransferase-like protein [Cubamyces lactineus]
MSKRILFVFTSVEKTLTGAQLDCTHCKPQGWFLPEAAYPYYILAAKHDIDFAAPKGANPPVDEFSVQYFKDVAYFLDDPVVKTKLANAKKLSEVKASDYDAIFYVGGHGPLLDLADDPVNIQLASEFLRAGKVTAAICNGSASFVGGTDANGEPVLKNRKLTCLSNVEEAEIGKEKDIPFLLESRITELGGHFEKAKEPWQAHVVRDGNLITGQNPASSVSIGEAINKALSETA